MLVVDGGASASSVSLLRRNEGTGFTKVAGPAIGAGANYGTVADFTGDGLPDVAISSFFGESANVLLNQGNSTFAHGLGSVNPTGIPMGHRSTAIATADFDGDTDLDLAVANWDGASISTRLRSAGGFTTGPTAAAGAPGSAPRYIVAGKFNDDSDPDLLVSNFNDGTVSILLGAAGATFSQPQGSPVDIGTAAGASVLGDFNADGLQDLAVVNLAQDNVSILLGQGGGAFIQGMGGPFTVGDGPVGIAAGDFDSNGRLDLAVTNNIAGTLSVLMSNGAGFTAEAPITIAENAGAYGVAVADFNADTRPDLAVTNDQKGRLTILLNDTPFPAPPPPPPPPNLDVDGDGVQTPTDCNDANPAIRPGVPDKPGDGIDQDCSGRDARFSVIARSIAAFSLTYPSGYTRFTSMDVKPVRAGDTVKLTCKGRGCERKRKTIRVKKDKRKLSLLKHLKGAHLKKGAAVQLRVTRPDTIGRVNTWKIRAPTAPKLVRRCVRPGAKKLSRCPA